MIANSQMKASRYERWAKARKTYREIIQHIEAGGRIVVGSYTRPTVYKSVDRFKCGRDSVYVARGKNWDSLIFSPIAFIN